MYSVLFIFFVLLYSADSFAYPQFIGHGYSSCVLCHVNPTGGGALTQYGRAVGSVAISDRALIPNSVSDDQLAEYSQFFGRRTVHPKFQPFVSYRGMYIKSTIGDKQGISQFIHMDITGGFVSKLDQKGNLMAVASLGQMPKRKSEGRVDKSHQSRLISREHFLVYKINKNVRLLAGMSDKFYGIKIPDHITFSRTITADSHNDQVHGIGLHYLNDKVEIASQLFTGNLFQPHRFRERGGAFTAEYSLHEMARIGGSFLVSYNDIFFREMMAVLMRLGVEKGHSILMELGRVDRTPAKYSISKMRSIYFLFQGFIRLKRGMYFFNTLEFFRPEFDSKKNHLAKFGSGLQYFLAPRIELRGEFSQSKNFLDNSVQKDNWNFMGQLHLWF